MLSVKDAEAIIYNLIPIPDKERDTEIVDLFTANNRVLAIPITSQLDFPHWDNSAMDGFAVREEDVLPATPENPAILEVIEEIAAGYQPQSILQPGQAARIFTGAMMPIGADTVVMQEYTRQEGNRVFILTRPKPQQFVRHKGYYYQAGAELLPAGIRVSGLEIGILAAAQCNPVRVYRKPKVAILSIGNELVAPDVALQLGQIVDSNQYTLAALVEQCGAEVIKLGIVRDEKAALKEVIQAITSDVIISCGGVSVGDYDYVEQVLQSMGSEIHIRGVEMKPGKPLTVATLNGKLYFGLPGNPASALVTFWRFVQPVINKLSGLSENWKPLFIKATIHQDLRSDGKRETYIWGKLSLTNGVYKFSPASGNHSSGNLINLAQTNGLAVLKPGETFIPSGAEVEVLVV